MIKKILVIGIIIIFLCLSINPSVAVDNVNKSSIPISSGNTLYVGGSGPGNYTSIQDAIDDATDGDTVFVYDDSSPYYENVVVDKSISLIGKDRNTTVIDGSGIKDVVYVSADWVNITGFTIQNSGSIYLDSGIKPESNFNCFYYNIISYNNAGIYLDNSSNNTISGNNASNNIYGIFLNDSSYNKISGNNASNSELGIYLKNSCNYNIVSGNSINSNGYYGINLYSSCNYNTITDNTAMNNTDGGILLSHESNSNDITENNISNNPHGIFQAYSQHNSIKGNNITSNVEDGICLRYSKFITIFDNIISNNKIGIRLMKSRLNTIKSNSILNNDEGIFLTGGSIGEFSESSTFNYITKNNFIDNERDAFFQNSRINRWSQNYWNEPLTSPKPIFGELYCIILSAFWIIPIRIPWIPQFDWRPALRPYDIEI